MQLQFQFIDIIFRCFTYYLSKKDAENDMLPVGTIQTHFEVELFDQKTHFDKEYKIAAENSRIANIPINKRGIGDKILVYCLIRKKSDC
jgi:hypothetical protein